MKRTDGIPTHHATISPLPSNPVASSPTVAMATLGCKVNQFESAAFQSGLEQEGICLVPFSQPADIYVINTCAVTARACAQSRQLIRRARRANPAARLVVTGCYAQVAPEEIEALTTTSLCLVGNSEKDRLVETITHAMLHQSCGGRSLPAVAIRDQKEICRLPVDRFAGRTRAYLKVQDGCDSFCAYCIVPLARGRSRSLPMAEAISQALNYARGGYREVVITGIHVGAYGRDLSTGPDLTSLVRKLASRTPEVRYRISSLEPTEISPELLQLMAGSANLMPHLHIPLQSGDDEVLKRMNRRYRAADFARIVSQVLGLLPEAAIGVDVLAGFPGETEAAFDRTCRLLEELPVAYLHVFPYSARPGTAAAAMPGQLSHGVKEERVARLRELDNKKRIAFYASQLGKVRPVLVEAGRGRAKMGKGFTDNYVPVHFQSAGSLANQIVQVRLERLAGHQLFGTVQAASETSGIGPGLEGMGD